MHGQQYIKIIYGLSNNTIYCWASNCGMNSEKCTWNDTEGRCSGVAGDVVVTCVFKDWLTPEEASGRTVGLQAEIWTKDLSNRKQGCRSQCLLSTDVQLWMYIHMYINESVTFSILSRNNLPELSTCVNRWDILTFRRLTSTIVDVPHR